MTMLALQSPAMLRFDHEKMKSLREAEDNNQPVAARRAKMSVTRWSDIESGKRTNVTVKTLGRIADALGCNPCDLLKRSPTRPPKRKTPR